MKPLSITALSLVLFVAGCFAVTSVDSVKVEGTAMLPTLKDGDMIRFDREFDKLDRGDIVIFYRPADKAVSFINRIVALPGETVEIREGEVVVNGKVLQESYIDPQFNEAQRSSEPILLSTDHYYVMGDNRDNASDSRIWGPLQKQFIFGKYTRKYSSAE